PPQPLLSFPTRRSSDLNQTGPGVYGRERLNGPGQEVAVREHVAAVPVEAPRQLIHCLGHQMVHILFGGAVALKEFAYREGDGASSALGRQVLGRVPE